MAWRMPGGGHTFPSGQTRQFIWAQFSNSSSKVPGSGWCETREKGHRAADRWIGWRIIRFSGEVGQFQPVCIDGYVPRFSQFEGRPGVIAMPMGKQNCFGPRTRAKSGFGCFEDLMCSPRNTGVDQHPRATRAANKKDIHET